MDKFLISRCIPTLSGALRVDETRDFSLAFPFPSWFRDDEVGMQASDGVGVKPLENWSLEVQFIHPVLLSIEKIYLQRSMGPAFSATEEISRDWRRQA